jgi:hypothetical protein
VRVHDADQGRRRASVCRGAQGAIASYTVTRIEGTLSGEGESPYEYLEVIEITDLDAYRALGSLPEFEQLLQEWSQYVAEAVMIHGDVIE